MPRLAKALDTLRAQVSAKWPGRSTSSDGWIASDAHHQQNPSSDHESDSRGIVHAVDFTHDPAHGFNSYDFADFLLKQRDPRIKYVISNRRIGGDENYAERNGQRAWTWARYNGSNPHDQHVHVSCNRANEDDARAWTIADADFVAASSGRGSWYSQFDGQYKWRDSGDKPDSNALGVPDSQQGFAMYNRATLGVRRYVKAPNGITLLLQQTDVGPHPTTGRAIDIAAVAAEHFGYSPQNFPTDGVFEWSAVVRGPALPPPEPSATAEAVLERIIEIVRPFIEKDYTLTPRGEAPMMITETAVVPVKSAWYSKINWTQVGGALLSLATTFAAGLPPAQAALVATGINVVQGLLTIVFRTWFNNTATPPAAG